MKGVIRLGDPTSHGGSVVAVNNQRSVVMDKPVACVGDECSCPIPGHHGCKIAEGDPNVLLDGIPVAFEGHKVSCGATLMSTIPTSGRE
jgi:uncharacterized Zn-binding protein involved in type VI secretion